MPYRRNAELPPAVKKALPPAAQTVFRRVFNQQKSDGLSDERAFQVAWTAVKNGWKKEAKTGHWVRKKPVHAAAELAVLGEIIARVQQMLTRPRLRA